MFNPSGAAGYDRSSIMYSPDGRIIQTEYAREAMRRGRIALGLRSNHGVVLAGKIDAIDLDFPNKKISTLDDNISAIFSGYAADGRFVLSRARMEAVVHQMNYSEPIDLKMLSTQLANLIHEFTQHGGARPLGIGLLLGGIDVHDDEPRLYFLNPGGNLTETRAKAIGEGDARAMKFIKGKHAEKPIDDLTVEELETLARDTIREVTEGEVEDKDIEIWSMSI